MEIREMTLTEGPYGVSYLENGSGRRVRLQHAGEIADFNVSLEEAAWHLAVWSRIVNAALQLETVEVTSDIPPSTAGAQELMVAAPARGVVSWRSDVDAMDKNGRAAWATHVLSSEAQYEDGVREYALQIISGAA